MSPRTCTNQVNNIIGVIDEIAFQTNLLALNAGVEAARAGESGKGFAVVAQEVRELAQRSAQAAREIKELIRASSDQVDSGVKLVSETGSSLNTIAGYILSMNGHMSAIAAAAKEQSAGLSEINTAVNRMDHVTQQNAAMVEESNAASATLATEAVSLRELIGHFQVGDQLMADQAQSRTAAHPQVGSSTRSDVASETFKPLRSAVPRVAGNTAVAAEWQEF